MRAAEEGSDPRDVRRREGRAVQGRRGRARRSRPDRFIRTTDPDHVRAAQEMVRRAYANGDIYLGHVRGLVLPERGLPERQRRPRDRPRHDLPEPPRRPAPVADRAELVLPPVGVPGAARAPLRRAPGLRPARLPPQRDARVHPRRASRTSRSAGPARAGGSRSRSRRTARPPSARTARGIPRRARSTSGTTR